MTLPAQGSRLIETRVFLVIMVFSIVSGLVSAFYPFLSILLFREFEFSAVEVGFVGALLSIAQYLFDPILFFVVLYVTCGGPLLNRIASVLVSLIFGSLVGYVIGGLIGSSVVAFQLAQPAGLFYQSVSALPQYVVGQTLMGFAVLAFSDVNLRWRSALPIDEFQKTRPGGVSLLAALYVVYALVSTLVLPVLTVFSSFPSTPRPSLIVTSLGVAFALIIVGQLVVAAGLYYGKKWGWIIAVISSASSLVTGLFTVGIIVGLSSTGTLMLTLIVFASMVGLMIDLLVLLYLLSINVRRFFGFVNPPIQVQDKSTTTEPA